jgi:L-alanine-DL-glutamate epimerase-like enolase superfamily enzyme
MENGRWYERGLLHPHFDYDAVPPHLNSLIDTIDEHGVVTLPERPGLGDDLAFDYIEDNTVGRW